MSKRHKKRCPLAIQVAYESDESDMLAYRQLSWGMLREGGHGLQCVYSHYEPNWIVYVFIDANDDLLSESDYLGCIAEFLDRLGLLIDRQRGS